MWNTSSTHWKATFGAEDLSGDSESKKYPRKESGNRLTLAGKAVKLGFVSVTLLTLQYKQTFINGMFSFQNKNSDISMQKGSLNTRP
jgi:hypothetical protein